MKVVYAIILAFSVASFYFFKNSDSAASSALGPLVQKVKRADTVHEYAHVEDVIASCHCKPWFDFSAIYVPAQEGEKRMSQYTCDDCVRSVETIGKAIASYCSQSQDAAQRFCNKVAAIRYSFGVGAAEIVPNRPNAGTALRIGVQGRPSLQTEIFSALDN